MLPAEAASATHPDYDAADIERYDLWYRGGRPFATRLAPLVLARREMESLDPTLRPGRLARAWYTPHVGAVIDLIVSKLVADPARFDAPEGSYWDRLTADCDGEGSDLTTVARRLAYDLLVQGRAWLALSFDSSDRREPAWLRLPVPAVDDWPLSADDAWFVRLHTTSKRRPGPLDRAATLDRWTYLDA